MVSIRKPRSTVELAPISNVVADDDAADLWDLEVSLGTHRVAETVLADARPSVDRHALADQGMSHRGAWSDIAVAPDEDAIADDGARCDCGAGADPRLAADNGAGLNGRPFGELRGGMDEHSIGVRGRCRGPRLKDIGIKQANGHGEGAMGDFSRDRGRPFRHETGIAALDEARSGLRCRQLTGIFAA
jgi:hypothetical protein